MKRPDIRFIPMSTDEGKIRFFGTLMPALLLLVRSPLRLVQGHVLRRIVPRGSVEAFVAAGADDAALVDSRETEGGPPAATGGSDGRLIVFVHGWATSEFDAAAFDRAKTFLARLTRLVEREGYRAGAGCAGGPGESKPLWAIGASQIRSKADPERAADRLPVGRRAAVAGCRLQ
jgi:hypothetical protein